MKVYCVEHGYTYEDTWLEKVFDSRLKADEYCIRQGCSKRMSEEVETDWENPESGERMFITEKEVE